MIKILIFIVILFQYVSSNWTIYDSTNVDPSGRLKYMNNFLYLDNADNIWILANNADELINFNENSIEFFDTINTNIPFMQISCASQGPNGDMYFGTFEDTTFEPKEKETCLIRFDGENWELYNQHNSPMHPYTIRDVLVTGEDEFWVATVIGLFHYKEGTWKSYFEDENDFKREIIRLSIDKNHNLYLFNSFREVLKANLNQSNIKFNKVELPLNASNGVFFPFVDSLSQLWFVSAENGLFKLEGDNYVNYDSSIFQNLNNITLYVARNKKTYCSVVNAVYEYKENSFWEKIFDIPDSISNGSIRLRGLDSKGSFWFAGGNRLYKYTPEQSSVAQKSNVTIFPNPSQANITVTAEQAITSLALYSLNLSKIKDITPNHTTTQEINISTLPAGVYFIKVNDEMLKFVRE